MDEESDPEPTGDELVRGYDNLRKRWRDHQAIETERAEAAARGQCPHDAGTRRFAQRTRSGTWQAWDGCALCRANLVPGRWLPHDEVDLTDALVVRDDVYENPPCRVCGAFGTELHHWAPKALFGDDADHWPTDHLCADCHAAWHRRIDMRPDERPFL